jgi:hypothetical protein
VIGCIYFERVADNPDGQVQETGDSALETRRRFCAPLIQSVAEKLKSMSAAVMMERMAIKVLDEWAAAGYPVPDRDFTYRGVDASGKPLRAIRDRELDLNLSWEKRATTIDVVSAGLLKVTRNERFSVGQVPVGCGGTGGGISR